MFRGFFQKRFLSLRKTTLYNFNYNRCFAYMVMIRSLIRKNIHFCFAGRRPSTKEQHGFWKCSVRCGLPGNLSCPIANADDDLNKYKSFHKSQNHYFEWLLIEIKRGWGSILYSLSPISNLAIELWFIISIWNRSFESFHNTYACISVPRCYVLVMFWVHTIGHHNPKISINFTKKVEYVIMN